MQPFRFFSDCLLLEEHLCVCDAVKKKAELLAKGVRQAGRQHCKKNGKQIANVSSVEKRNCFVLCQKLQLQTLEYSTSSAFNFSCESFSRGSPIKRFELNHCLQF